MRTSLLHRLQLLLAMLALSLPLHCMSIAFVSQGLIYHTTSSYAPGASLANYGTMLATGHGRRAFQFAHLVSLRCLGPPSALQLASSQLAAVADCVTLSDSVAVGAVRGLQDPRAQLDATERGRAQHRPACQ